MDTTITLTPTEVIDRVQTARTFEHAGGRRTAPPRRPLGTAAPLPRRVPGRLGRRPRPLRPLVHPWPVPVHRWSRSSHRPPSPQPWASPSEPAKQLLADALELTYRLPRLLDLVERGAVPVWRARAISRETHDLSAWRRSPTRTGSSARRPVEDRPGRRRPAGRGSPVLLRPRPRHRRRGTRTRASWGLATPPRQPRHHRRRDDPGHPRRPALRPDRDPHRRRTTRTSATPTRSTSGGHGRSGSSPTPSTPWTSCPAATPTPTAGAGAR